MRRAPILIAALAACAGATPGTARETGEEGPLELGAWRKEAASLLEEMGLTVRRREKDAYDEELVRLIERGARPHAAFVDELGKLLVVLPPGRGLRRAIAVLASDSEPRAAEVLIDALGRDDFTDLKGRPLAETLKESRRRIMEYNLALQGDRMYAMDASKEPRRLEPRVAARLETQLSASDQRRVRCAAYLLGGARCAEAAPELAAAARRQEGATITRAVLIEALGRADPQAGAAEMLAAAEADSVLVRAASIPFLGDLRGEAAEKLHARAMEDGDWRIRRAAVAACRRRRDTAAMDLLMERFERESPGLEYDILQAVLDITGGIAPPDTSEWKRWWRLARQGFRPAGQGPRGAGSERGEKKGGARTQLILRRPSYFGLQVWSDRLALVCDISGSMEVSALSLGASGVGIEGKLQKGSAFAIAKDQITGLLRALAKKGKQAYFNIIPYNQDVHPMSPHLVAATRANLRNALRFVKTLKADGGTNIYGALLKALSDPQVDTIFLLSDGEPTDGARTDPDDILEAVHMLNRFRRTRIHTIQIGEDSPLMRALAEVSGGEYRRFQVASEAPTAN